jgi:hypothetical protein
MLAHQMQLKIHFAFLCNPRSPSSGQRTSSSSRYNSRFPPIRVLHHAVTPTPPRDTIRVSLQFESFIMPSRQLLEIQFAFPSNSSPPSCRRTSTCQRDTIRNASAPTPPRDALRVSLQIQFEFIMLAPLHAGASASESRWGAIARPQY